MRRNAEIALRTYLVPLTSTRALRIALLIVVLFLGLVGLAVLLKPVSEFFSDATLVRLRRLLVGMGVPLAAILLAELPLRDGITHRTLLYPVLGPVPRITLAMVRTAATALLMATGISVLVVLIRVLQGADLSPLAREVPGIFLGSMVYIGFFGVVHLLTGRGMLASLAIYWLIDSPLAGLPFALRNLSPSYHYLVVAGQQIETLPIPVTPPTSSVTVSVLVLVILTVALFSAIAFLFSRKNLGEIC